MRTCSKCQRTYPDDVGFCLIDGTELATAEGHARRSLSAALAGKYRLVGRLSEGSLAVVFLAEQMAAGRRRVALKVFRRQLLDDPDFLLHFERGMSAAAHVHHPNVVEVFEANQTMDDIPYVAMERVEGESLRKAASRNGSLPVALVMEIATQLAQGLDAAHHLGIVHGDLRPENCLIERPAEGKVRVKITDFGTARLRESAAQFVFGLQPGNPAYRSPEQTAGKASDDLDPRADVYALGVLVFELLTGQLSAGIALSALRRDFPAGQEVEQVLRKALERDPEERYATALEFGAELLGATNTPLPPEMQSFKRGGIRQVQPPDANPEMSTRAVTEAEGVKEIVKPVLSDSWKTYEAPSPAASPDPPMSASMTKRPVSWRRCSDVALQLAAFLSGSLLLLVALLVLELRWGMFWIMAETLDEGNFASLVMAWGIGILAVSIALVVGGLLARLRARQRGEALRPERECSFGFSVARIGLVAVLPFVLSATIFLFHGDWRQGLVVGVFPLSVVASALFWTGVRTLLARRHPRPGLPAEAPARPA